MSESFKSYKSNKVISQQVQQTSTKLKANFLRIHYNSLLSSYAIVFIGNSRIGKSTLSAVLSGMIMQVKLYENSQLKIEPKDQIHRNKANLIQHSKKSVTQFPNMHPMIIDGKTYAIIDLPGFKDTSYFKQVSNWHYIKNILEKLQKNLFVMVIQVHAQERTIKQKEIDMMIRFKQAFPSSSKGKGLDNLVIIVNFLQFIGNQQKQSAIKKHIREKVKLALQKYENQNKFSQQEKLWNFYEKAFEDSRFLLVQRASMKNPKYQDQNELKKGIQYSEPKILAFAKENISHMQKTQQSPYKINLIQQKNEEGQKLKKIIVAVVEQSLESIWQKNEQYKNLFSQIIKRLSYGEGGNLRQDDLRKLKKYYLQKNLRIYEQIQMYDYGFEQSCNFETPQEIVLEIIELFRNMNEKKKEFADLKLFYQNFQKQIFQFLKLILCLSKLVFPLDVYQQLRTMTQSFWKSIRLDIKNILYLNQSIEDFNLKDDLPPELFSVKNATEAYQADQKNRKVGAFVTSLKEYIKSLKNKIQKMETKKIDVNLVWKLKEACKLMNYSDQNYQILILFYKICHMNLFDHRILNDQQKVNTIIKKIREMSQKLNKDQADKVSQWKKQSKQWEKIKNKGFAEMTRFLAGTNFDKQKIIGLYLKINFYSDQVLKVLRQLVQQAQSKQSKRPIAYKLCEEVGKYLQNSCEYTKALDCYSLAQTIYLYEDQKSVIDAKKKYLNLTKKMVSQQIQQEIQNYSKNFSNSPWTSIDQFSYQAVIQIVFNQSNQLQNKKESIGNKYVNQNHGIYKAHSNNFIHCQSKNSLDRQYQSKNSFSSQNNLPENISKEQVKRQSFQFESTSEKKVEKKQEYLNSSPESSAKCKKQEKQQKKPSAGFRSFNKK